MANKRIAVLGAGPMGLATAYELVKQGYQPVIYEADDRVGGMTASFNFAGTLIERYYHFHCTSDSAFFNILGELKLEHHLKWVKTNMAFYYQNKIHPWGTPLALLTFPGLNIIDKIRYGLHAFYATKRKNWHSLDNIDAVSWIKKWIGKNAYNVLWAKLFDYKFYHHANQLSAAWIWSRIKRIGQSRYNMFEEKLGYLEGGSEILLQALKNAIIAHGGEVKLKTPIFKVIVEQGKVKGVATFAGIEYFDNVISTIPLPYLPTIMPDLPNDILEKFQSIKNIAVVCVIAKIKKQVSPYFWLNINDPAMDIPGIIEYTNLRKLDQHIVYVPFYMPGDHPKFQDSNQVFLDKVKSYLKKINPLLKENDFIALHTSRYQHAQPICTPNHLHRLPNIKLPIKGLWAADTSYYYPEDRGISESIAFGREMAKRVIINA